MSRAPADGLGEAPSAFNVQGKVGGRMKATQV